MVTPPKITADDGLSPNMHASIASLKGASDNWAAKGALGRLTLEGKLAPRDAQEAVHLIRQSPS